jgi:hypothetical protein
MQLRKHGITDGNSASPTFRAGFMLVLLSLLSLVASACQIQTADVADLLARSPLLLTVVKETAVPATTSTLPATATRPTLQQNL